MTLQEVQSQIETTKTKLAELVASLGTAEGKQAETIRENISGLEKVLEYATRLATAIEADIEDRRKEAEKFAAERQSMSKMERARHMAASNVVGRHDIQGMIDRYKNMKPRDN